MTVTEKQLLTVKAISPKLVKQIEVVNLDWATGSLHQKLFVELKLVNEGGNAKVLGWTWGENIIEGARHSPIRYKWWLVRYKGQLYWFMPPGEESENEVADLHWPGLEQLFVG